MEASSSTSHAACRQPGLHRSHPASHTLSKSPHTTSGQCCNSLAAVAYHSHTLSYNSLKPLKLQTMSHWLSEPVAALHTQHTGSPTQAAPGLKTHPCPHSTPASFWNTLAAKTTSLVPAPPPHLIIKAPEAIPDAQYVALRHTIVCKLVHKALQQAA